MIEVVSIKFKNRGKAYSFDPRNVPVQTGDKVVVETAKGLELADCTQGRHAVEEKSVVQPLRPVVRVATADDLRVADINLRREAEAVEICRKKIVEHGLDMKLVDAECSFEGNKITFFFTSDGRVDFRELVKDLAGVFRTRIELRQIGVRDEAKMIGGIAVCGRPYCCSQFLEDFQPVSTKMAKIQSLSLNPAKISGSCGRLMCCLRYEQEAYEDLVRHVPKQGAFVETKDGYGTAVQVNLLRQNVKVRLDGDSDDTLHLYKANELAAVPGGRPRDGEEPPHVLHYVPETEEAEEPEDEWRTDALFADEKVAPLPEAEPEKKRSRRRRKNKHGGESGAETQKKAEKNPDQPQTEAASPRKKAGEKRAERSEQKKQEKKPEKKPEKKQENKQGAPGEKNRSERRTPKQSQPAGAPGASGEEHAKKTEGESKRRHHRGGRRHKSGGGNQSAPEN